VRLDEREAQRYGVHAVPYFVIGNKYAIPGAMPVETMERVLKNVMDEEAKAAQNSMMGMSCGPDGCHFEG
jgi:predicted DsbA family dithiol-disulfide isomerase